MDIMAEGEETQENIDGGRRKWPCSKALDKSKSGLDFYPLARDS